MIIFMMKKMEKLYYRYRTPDDKGVLINSWIILKQNEENEWKVRIVLMVKDQK